MKLLVRNVQSFENFFASMFLMMMMMMMNNNNINDDVEQSWFFQRVRLKWDIEMWKMSRFLLSFFSPFLLFFSFAILFFLSSFSPSVIHDIPKQHQNSHRPFSSEISKRNVIACKASTFLPSKFLLWEVCLSWLFLVSDSFFFLFFFLFYYHAPTTHSLTALLY